MFHRQESGSPYPSKHGWITRSWSWRRWEAQWESYAHQPGIFIKPLFFAGPCCFSALESPYSKNPLSVSEAGPPLYYPWNMTLLPQLDHLQRRNACCLTWVRGDKIKLSCGNTTMCRDDACILTKSIRKSMHLLHLLFLNVRLLLQWGMQVAGFGSLSFGCFILLQEVSGTIF